MRIASLKPYENEEKRCTSKSASIFTAEETTIQVTERSGSAFQQLHKDPKLDFHFQDPRRPAHFTRKGQGKGGGCGRINRDTLGNGVMMHWDRRRTELCIRLFFYFVFFFTLWEKVYGNRRRRCFFTLSLFTAMKWDWVASTRIMKSALVHTISSKQLLAFATPARFPTSLLLFARVRFLAKGLFSMTKPHMSSIAAYFNFLGGQDATRS